MCTVLYVGIDMAKKSFDAAYCKNREGKKLSSYKNVQDGFKKLDKAIKAKAKSLGAEKIHLIVEPTGRYEIGLALYAYEQGWLVTKPNPYTLRQWAEGVGYRVKTDPLDARMCSEYGFIMQPKAQDLLPLEVRELDYLLRRVDDQKKMLKMEQNRLESASAAPDMPKSVIQDIEKQIEFISSQQDELTKKIKQHVKQYPELQKLYRQLLGVPGIGPKTVLPLIVILHRFNALTAGEGGKKQLTAFLGLDSQIHESGTSVRGIPSISKKGDKVARARLYMSALGGIRGFNVLRDFYQLMVARGKAKKIALVACSRKILHWAWAIFKSAKDFDPTLAATKAA